MVFRFFEFFLLIGHGYMVFKFPPLPRIWLVSPSTSDGYLFEVNRVGETEILQPLIHSVKGHNSQSWVTLKAEAGTALCSHLSSRDPYSKAISVSFSGTSAGSWVRSRVVGLRLAP